MFCCSVGAGLAVLLAVWGTSSLPVSGQTKYVPVARARCGPGSQPETGLQGQTTAAERFSAGSAKAYTCNLELVGQFQGEGAAWDMGISDACAYIGTTDGPGRQNRGTVVLDVADSRNPRPVAYLDSLALIEPNESISIHAGRKLLAATKYHQQNFEVYDISDCRRPVLKGMLKLPDIEGHASNFSPDGRTYFGTSFKTQANNVVGPRNSVFAIDLSDPSRPREIARYTPEPNTLGDIHHVHINAEGTRAFVSLMGSTANGVALFDISDIQARRPNAQFRRVKRLWTDGLGTQSAMPVRINNRPYLISTGGLFTADGPSAACAQGLPISGFARIHDISDEQNPKFVSSLMLEVQDPANCSRVLNDTPPNTQGFFCAVDNPQNARVIACGYYDAGVRVFDIHDPARPREIAYYKPPAPGKTPVRPGSWWASGIAPGYRSPAERMADAVPIVAGFRPGGEIWFIGHDGGFQVVRFTDWIKNTEKSLFSGLETRSSF
jgi:hypothetical protein